MDTADPTLRWLRDALPDGCAVVGGPIGAPGPSAYPAEEEAIARAVASRRYEFRAGRAQARRALALIGCPAAEIPKGAAGEPVWPAGFTGSICHTDDLAFAAAATGAVRAVGIDVDSDTPLDAEVRPFVCRPGEMESVEALSETGVDPAKRLFVAKEAFMKLNYALTGTVVDFLDIQIDFQVADAETHRFRATPFPVAGGAAPAGYGGRLGWGCGRIAAIMYVRRADDIQPRAGGLSRFGI